MTKQTIKSKDTVEVIPDTPKVTPQTFLRKLLQNVENWVEVYFWVPVSFLSIYFMALAAYYLSGRAPRMNLDWFPELGANLFKIVCAIALTSVAKQAWWGWMTMDEKIENVGYAGFRMIVEVSVFFTLLWVLFNR
jgi:hypothetical protein